MHPVHQRHRRYQQSFGRPTRHRALLCKMSFNLASNNVFLLFRHQLLVSGGVDSTVCAALLDKALAKDQVIPLHINNGFMRKGETPFVQESLAQLGVKLRVVNATHNFMQGTTSVPLDNVPLTNANAVNNKGGGGGGGGISGSSGGPRTRLTKMLCATTNPEEKRKIIGDVFVRVANDAMTEMGLKPDEVFLGQGTLRPDLIESASLLASGKIC